MSLLLGEVADELPVSLEDDDDGVLEVELSIVDDEDDDEGVEVDESVVELVLGLLVLEPLVLEPLVPCALESEVGRAEVDGVLAGVGAVLGLDAAYGELLLGTELVCAMVTPAALTSATTAAMLKVLDTSFMCRTPIP